MIVFSPSLLWFSLPDRDWGIVLCCTFFQNIFIFLWKNDIRAMAYREVVYAWQWWIVPEKHGMGLICGLCALRGNEGPGYPGRRKLWTGSARAPPLLQWSQRTHALQRAMRWAHYFIIWLSMMVIRSFLSKLNIYDYISVFCFYYSNIQRGYWLLILTLNGKFGEKTFDLTTWPAVF